MSSVNWPAFHHGTHDLNMWHWLSLGYTPDGVEVWCSPESSPGCRTSKSLPRANSRTGCVNAWVKGWLVARVQVESATGGRLARICAVEPHNYISAEMVFIVSEAAGPALAPNRPIMNGHILNGAGNNTLAHCTSDREKMR
jgi:hypothetical protein